MTVLFFLVLSIASAACGGGGGGGGGSSERILRASESSGFDEVWEARPFFGLETWGIRGSGVPESGEIWFDEFPWESGRYEVILLVGLEQDGAAFYQLRAGSRLLRGGRFPYLNGALNCEGAGDAAELSLGVHQLNQGERISMFGQSTYECGDAGAYTLWEAIRFEPVIEPGDEEV